MTKSQYPTVSDPPRLIAVFQATGKLTLLIDNSLNKMSKHEWFVGNRDQGGEGYQYASGRKQSMIPRVRMTPRVRKGMIPRVSWFILSFKYT